MRKNLPAMWLWQIFKQEAFVKANKRMGTDH